jgi:hypothetical protein
MVEKRFLSGDERLFPAVGLHYTVLGSSMKNSRNARARNDGSPRSRFLDFGR